MSISKNALVKRCVLRAQVRWPRSLIFEYHSCVVAPKDPTLLVAGHCRALNISTEAVCDRWRAGGIERGNGDRRALGRAQRGQEGLNVAFCYVHSSPRNVCRFRTLYVLIVEIGAHQCGFETPRTD